MKCGKCGYIVLDDLGKCPKCAAFLSLTLPDGENEETLSMKLEEDSTSGDISLKKEKTQDPVEENDILRIGMKRKEPSPEEETLSLRSLQVDFTPAGTDQEEFIPEDRYSPFLDDSEQLSEDLWLEEGAGFGVRLMALSVDMAILAGVMALFTLGALLVLSRDGSGWSRFMTAESLASVFLPFYLLGLFLSGCYFTFFLGWSGRTPGKTLMKLDVHRTDGGRMTYIRAFLRWVGYLVSLTFLGMGFLWVALDGQNRGWHDYLSGTWVKDLRKEE